MNPDNLMEQYLEMRERQRSQAVNDLLGSFTERERGLVRDAAVMGFLLGTMHGPTTPDNHPMDSDVVSRVVSHCQPHRDLYPTINRRGRRRTRKGVES